MEPPVNKKMSLARLFNNLPTYLAFDDVETLTDAGAYQCNKGCDFDRHDR